MPQAFNGDKLVHRNECPAVNGEPCNCGVDMLKEVAGRLFQLELKDERAQKES